MTKRPTLQFFEVGGCVRDDLLGLASNDVDFTVTGCDTFEEMVAELVTLGFKVFVESPENVTARAKVPASMPELLARTQVADFVLARKESSASDGRRPDLVEVGTLADDLARRDFTVNALARTVDGELVDLCGGQADLEAGTLRFVGDAMTRVREDALRVVRGLRFMLTKGLVPTATTWSALTCDESVALLRATKADGKRVVSVERLQMELDKMMAFDAWETFRLLESLDADLREALLGDGLLKVKATVRPA